MGSGEHHDDDSLRLAAVLRYGEASDRRGSALDTLAALAARGCGTPMAAVSLVGASRVLFKGRHGIDLDEVAAQPGLCATAVHHSGPYVLVDARNDPRARFHPLVSGEPHVRFYAAVPIVIDDGRHIGTVCIMDTEPQRATTNQLATLRDLATVAAEELQVRRELFDELSVEQEARAKAEVEAERMGSIAETLQTTLTPSRLPEVAGLDIAAHYEPFSADDVGGDFYDVFPLDDRRWGVFVGDVVGKGIEAAVFTSLARYSLRTAAVVEQAAPGVLAAVNEAVMLDPQSDDAVYCTVAYADLGPHDDGSWSLNVALGGHPPPLIIRSDGEVQQVRTGGTIVGVFPGEEYPSEAVSLQSGDTIVMYSDGMTDIPTEDGWLGVDGVQAALTDAPVYSANDAVALLRKLIAESKSPLRDDLVIVAITALAA